MTEMMTLQEVADYLRVTNKTISRLLKANSIPASKIGRQWRFDKALLDNWLRNKTSYQRLNILVVDDEESIRMVFRDTLGELGHRVIDVGTSVEGLELVKKEDFDLAFLDLRMPIMNGAELFKHIKKLAPSLPVIIITGYPDSQMMAAALAYGPFGVMSKPFDESGIIEAVNNFLRIGSRNTK